MEAVIYETKQIFFVHHVLIDSKSSLVIQVAVIVLIPFIYHCSSSSLFSVIHHLQRYPLFTSEK